MKDFEGYLDKMGYSWNDFDRPYEMANLIEQYADEKVRQALSIANVVGRSEQLVCDRCNGIHNNITPCPKCGGLSESLFEAN